MKRVSRTVMIKWKKGLRNLVQPGFQRKLLTASLETLLVDSPLRFNNFACSIRELSRHVLNDAAPVTSVEQCIWYKNETGETGKLSRGERVQYAVHGGLCPKYLKRLGFDVAEYKKPVIKSIELLNKYVHVNPDTFGMKEEDIYRLTKEVVESFVRFTKGVSEARQLVLELLNGQIKEDVIEHCINETHDDIDILASHYYLADAEVEKVIVDSINHRFAVIKACGSIGVKHQYGSDYDYSVGDGFQMEENYPFVSILRVPVKPVLDKGNIEKLKFEVDTSAFYN